jgi:hypothetical protein
LIRAGTLPKQTEEKKNTGFAFILWKDKDSPSRDEVAFLVMRLPDSSSLSVGRSLSERAIPSLENMDATLIRPRRWTQVLNALFYMLFCITSDTAKKQRSLEYKNRSVVIETRPLIVVVPVLGL